MNDSIKIRYYVLFINSKYYFANLVTKFKPRVIYEQNKSTLLYIFYVYFVTVSSSTVLLEITELYQIAFQKTSARTRRFLSKKKSPGWHAFCKSLEPCTPVIRSLVWKRIKFFRRSQTAFITRASSATKIINNFFNWYIA